MLSFFMAFIYKWIILLNDNYRFNVGLFYHGKGLSALLLNFFILHSKCILSFNGFVFADPFGLFGGNVICSVCYI